MMQLKLDENIDARISKLLRDAGHDAATVREQGLCGSGDADLYRICVSEKRALITLDLDFSNTLQYRPENTSGVIVLRGPNDLFPTTRILVETLVEALKHENPANHLWIIEPGRLRIHEPS
jgi:predicted nuclease of predicted toxin-antitoxin system